MKGGEEKMKIIKTSLALGTGAVMMLVNTSLVFGSDVVVKKTGANSYNKVVMSSKFVQSMSQLNVSNVNNQVMVSQNTGNNSADKNTGSGDVMTGDASAGVLVMNAGNSNELTGLESCGCEQEMVTTKVSNTGYKSTNMVKLNRVNMMKTMQKNLSSRLNMVAVAQNTGLNTSDKNTGDGSVDGGSVEVMVDVANEGDSNTN